MEQKERKTLGQLLKQSRDLCGFTLRQVEDAIGISNAYLSQLENDKIKKPSANVLYKLSKMYGIGLEKLLEASGIISISTPEIVRRAKGIRSPTVATPALGSILITPEEEQTLIEYLRFLRFKQRNANK